MSTRKGGEGEEKICKTVARGVSQNMGKEEEVTDLCREVGEVPASCHHGGKVDAFREAAKLLYQTHTKVGAPGDTMQS